LTFRTARSSSFRKGDEEVTGATQGSCALADDAVYGILGESPVKETTCESVARQVRVERLRQLVASGNYRVSPQRLALRILVKALRQR
jgi:anti-sigma28 factor (negative regulator of flagellin synthesis)